MENQLVGVLNTDRGDDADLVEDGAVRNSLHAMMNKKMYIMMKMFTFTVSCMFSFKKTN